MPLVLTPSHLPSGAPCVRAECHGDITKEDAEAVIQQIAPGGPFFGIPMLGLTQDIGVVTAEARQVFGKRGDISAQEAWTAAVVTKTVVRVVTNFLMRVNGIKKTRLFPTEAQAIQWLEERVKEDQSRAKAG